MNRRLLLNALLVLIAFGWLLAFAHNGLSAPFSIDDLMNLDFHLSVPAGSLVLDNLRYWSTAYRPLGGLFYVALYHFVGFDPLPFRLACFALLGINLVLLGRFTLLVSGSREVAFLALLLAGYHARLIDLYYSTGTVYELLCYAFYFAAFNSYIRARAGGKPMGWRRLGILAALYLCALNAKEMAVSLPVLLAAYEVIYHGKDLRDHGPRWLWRDGRGVLASVLLTVPYVVGKLTGPGSLVEVPAYRLTLSPARYLHAFHLYLNTLLYQDHVFRDANTVQLVAAMLVLALLLRSRPMLLAWCFLLVSFLPVAFIAHYDGFFLYFPLAGWALYAAVLLVQTRKLLIKVLGTIVRANEEQAGQLATASSVALPILLALLLAPQHRRESVKSLALFESGQPPSRENAQELISLRPTLPHGARVAFVGDPFPQNAYYLLFLTRALYRDRSITVDKVASAQDLASKPGPYDSVFLFQNGQLAAMASQRAIPDH